MGKVVALMDDLFFQMKLAETAKLLGVELKVATSGDALMDLMESNPKLVVVDLNARSHPIETIEKLRLVRTDVHVVGFLSHVQVDLKAQAQKTCIQPACYDEFFLSSASLPSQWAPVFPRSPVPNRAHRQ